MKRGFLAFRAIICLTFVIPVIYTINGCSSDVKSKKNQDIISNEPEEDGTAKMIKQIKDAYAQIDPMKVGYYLNSARAENFKSMMSTAEPWNVKLEANAKYAYELINAGKSTEAIMELNKLIEEFKKYGVDANSTYSIYRLLALAYMRLGEQDNCIGNNNSESCIIPIQGGGIYSLRKGSETAISIYESMLNIRPNDLETVWMLNIAYMTLGQYPDEVPGKWLIPPSAFNSDYKLPPFKNISNQLGISTLGLSGGSCVDDFNNDGFLDIIASSWGAFDQVKVFLNNGDGSFRDATENSGIIGITGGLNMIHADYDNDGLKDVLILRGAWFGNSGRIPNSLLKNNGNGTFSDVTITSGLLSKYPTQTATWTDVNNDGWLDLFIGNESSTEINAPCELFLNDKGIFQNITDQSGLGQVRGFVKGVTSGDVNNDGWQDIYISFMGQPNILLLNNGIWSNNSGIRFTNAAQSAGVQEPIESFPVWIWDQNNDGHLDIFAASYSIRSQQIAQNLASNYLGQKFDDFMPKVYQNNGDGTFTDESKKMGLSEPIFAMGCNYGDLDNDGFLDFYIGTGDPNFTSLVPNKMYRNSKGKIFQDVTTSGRFGHIQKGHGVSFGDFDNDGDQDIFHVLGGAYEGDVFGDAFFENPIGNKKSWVTLVLEGTTSNKSAIGARIKIITQQKNGKEQIFYRVVSTGGSFGSSSIQQEVGLDEAIAIKEIEIRWPNAAQSIEVYNNIDLNRFVKITEGNNNIEYLERPTFSFNKIQ